MPDVLDDPSELGRRISAARAYSGGTIESFAAELGITHPTLRSYERGDLGNYAGSRELRYALAEKVQQASGAPPEWFDLREPNGAALADLHDRVDQVEKRQALGADDFEALRAELVEIRRLLGRIEPPSEGTEG